MKQLIAQRRFSSKLQKREKAISRTIQPQRHFAQSTIMKTTRPSMYTKIQAMIIIVSLLASFTTKICLHQVLKSRSTCSIIAPIPKISFNSKICDFLSKKTEEIAEILAKVAGYFRSDFLPLIKRQWSAIDKLKKAPQRDTKHKVRRDQVNFCDVS